MPEYRQDPVSGGWVIIARERAERPSEFIASPVHRRLEPCPFCAGNEGLTPCARALYPPPRNAECGDPWQVRVIANKYPALVESVTAGAVLDARSLFISQPGFGVHEVIVESPQHTASFSELTAEQAYWSFIAYRDRLHRAAGLPGLAYGLLFKNCRAGGGATLEHTHSQLLASSLVPSAIQTELGSAARFHAAHGECLFCELSRHEMANGDRIVRITERFVAFCPFASRFPYETWVLPRGHAGRFELVKLEDLDELSQLFQQIVRSLEKIFPRAPHNYWIHTSPFDTRRYDYYHWHIELIPRVTTQAGFEWGSGCLVNPVAPEDAAASLREGLD